MVRVCVCADTDTRIAREHGGGETHGACVRAVLRVRAAAAARLASQAS